MEHKIKFIKRTFFALLIICVSKTQSQSFLTSGECNFIWRLPKAEEKFEKVLVLTTDPD